MAAPISTCLRSTSSSALGIFDSLCLTSNSTSKCACSKNYTLSEVTSIKTGGGGGGGMSAANLSACVLSCNVVSPPSCANLPYCESCGTTFVNTLKDFCCDHKVSCLLDEDCATNGDSEYFCCPSGQVGCYEIYTPTCYVPQTELCCPVSSYSWGGSCPITTSCCASDVGYMCCPNTTYCFTDYASMCGCIPNGDISCNGGGQVWGCPPHTTCGPLGGECFHPCSCPTNSTCCQAGSGNQYGQLNTCCGKNTKCNNNNGNEAECETSANMTSCRIDDFYWACSRTETCGPKQDSCI